MQNKRVLTIQRVVMTAICMALYFVLCAYLTIRVGNVHITVAPLVIIVCAVLFGPIESTISAFGGAFLTQMVQYGMSATTLMWCAPDTLRGLLLGLCAYYCFRRSRYFDSNKVFFVVANIVIAVLTTIMNTVAIGVDAYVFGYFSWKLIYASLLTRFLLGIGTTVVLTIVSFPVIYALRRAHFGRLIQKEEPIEDHDLS